LRGFRVCDLNITGTKCLILYFMSTDTRVLDISQQGLISLRAPIPEQEESVEVQQEEESSLESEEDEALPVTGITAATTSVTASIQFIQVSEIEPAPFEEGAEWVERPDTTGHTEPRDLHEEAAPVAEEVIFIYITFHLISV